MYSKPIEIRWADLDPNFHVLHSKYYDFGAFVRVCFLTEHGLTQQELQTHRMGPILLREECIFRREIKFGDQVEIDLHLTKARQNMLRWSIRHTISRNGVLAAELNVDGSWIDMDLRKMHVPPEFFADVFKLMPRSDDFQWL